MGQQKTKIDDQVRSLKVAGLWHGLAIIKMSYYRTRWQPPGVGVAVAVARRLKNRVSKQGEVVPGRGLGQPGHPVGPVDPFPKL